MLDLTPRHVKRGCSLRESGRSDSSGMAECSAAASCVVALPEVTTIYDRVLAFIDDPSEREFGALALAVFAHQYENCAPYRAYCVSRDRGPGSVIDWRDMPPVPVQAFREAELSCGPPQRVFLSTGTTVGLDLRSRHVVPDLRLYHRSALAGLRRFLLPDVDSIDMVSLIPSVDEQPQSSLAQMVAWAGDALAAGDLVYAARSGELVFDVFVDGLRRSERDGRPLCIFTTTGALIRFLEFAAAQSLEFRLPHGSRMMDTGGDKGAPRRLSRRGVLHAVWRTFAIPGYFAVNEYGMAELSSQYYDSVIRDRFDGVHRGRHLMSPAWLRTAILHIETLTPVADGEPGLICHYDLANAGSAMAVLSEDLGILEDGRLRLIGRAPLAETRGCSLGVAEWTVT